MVASSARASAFSASTLRVDLRGAIEEVVVLQQVGLVGQDLLHAQRPLLVPRARQAERLVPGRQLDGAGAGVLGQRDGQHLNQDAVDVVLGLLLRSAQRVDLHAVAEAPRLRVGDAVALAPISSHRSVKARILQISVDEADAGVHEERNAARTPARSLLGGPSGAFTASSTAIAVASA